MTDDPYKAPSIDTDHSVGRTGFRAILTVPIGVVVGVLPGAFATIAIGKIVRS